MQAKDLAAPQSIHGGVESRRIADLYLHVAVELEHALAGGSPVVAVLLDLSKIFDPTAHSHLM